MRFSADIFFTDTFTSHIPTNYRRDFASLLKESIKRMNIELYQQLWKDDKSNPAKPFTFCAYLPNAQSIKGNDNNSLKISDDMSNLIAKLFISSSDPVILISFYNALLNISGYKLFGNAIELKHFRLLREKPFNENYGLFKTMSPIIIRNMEERNDKKKREAKYLICDNAEFKENLYHSVKRMCKNFIGSDYDLKNGDFKFSPINCKTVKIHHYKEIIPAVSGTFKIEAPAETLKLIYDAGLGARRSQGFGMLDAADSHSAEMEG